jgi:hypothetical protein
MADQARTKQGQRLGELLLDADSGTKRQLAKAAQAQVKGDKRKIGEILVEGRYLNYWERPAYDINFGINYQFMGF